MRKSLVLGLLLGLGVSMATVPAVSGAELAGVELADSVELGERTLVLNGLGLRKKFGFKVYVGGLYLPAKNSDAGSILGADEPRRSEMVFLRKVAGNQLCGGWNECLEGNTPGASDELGKAFEELCGMMADVGKGDRMVASYVPGEGCAISIKDSAQGTIEGKDFADALFACWIGPKPATTDLKRGMLGQ